MTGWKVPATLRASIPEGIADGLWVQIQHPRRLPFSTMQAFLALTTSDGSEEVAGFDFGTARDLATGIIVDWNLPDESTPGAFLPLPSKDLTVWERIPAMAVIQTVFEAVGDGVKAGSDPNSSAGSANS